MRTPLFAAGIVVWPVVSGLFFGLVAGVLALRSGSFGRASDIGALVGGVMFTSHAVALCVVHANAATKRARHSNAELYEKREARAG